MSLSPQTASSDDWEAVLSFFNDLKDEYKDNVMSNAENLTTSDEEQDIAIVVKDDTANKLIYVFWDSAKDAFRTASIKFLGTNWVYENSIDVSWGDSAAAWGFIANSANVVIHTYDNIISLEDAEADIKMSSTLSEDQKAYALEQTEKLRWGYGATSLLRIVATAAGYGFSAAGNPLLGTLVSTVLNTAANLADNYLDKSLAYYAAGGQGTYLRWILDPSGYAYDAYTNERLQGFTVTAYWIEYVEGDLTFWDRVPTDTEYGTLWNATEYSQQNPLLTDSNGGICMGCS